MLSALKGLTSQLKRVDLVRWAGVGSGTGHGVGEQSAPASSGEVTQPEGLEDWVTAPEEDSEDYMRQRWKALASAAATPISIDATASRPLIEPDEATEEWQQVDSASASPQDTFPYLSHPPSPTM